MTVEQLVEQLQNPDESARHGAIRRLRVLGGRLAVSALIGALDDPSEDIRVYAALTLGEMELPQAIPALSERMNGDARGVERALYAMALSETHLPEAVLPLIQVLDDPDEHVLKEACVGLMILGDCRAIPPLLQMLHHPSWSVRSKSCSALIELGMADSRVAAAVERLAQEPEAAIHPNELKSMRWHLTRVSGAHDGGPAREVEEEKQQEFGAATADLHHSDPEVRYRAVLRLDGSRAPKVVAAMIDTLNDPSLKVRSWAVLSLGHLQAPEAVPAFIEHLRDDESIDVRAKCASFLGRMGGDQAVEPLIVALSHPHWKIWRAAIGSLGETGDARAIPPLILFLDHLEWKTRYSAARALIKLKASDPKLVAALERLAQEPEAEEHDLQVDEWNCNLERHRRLMREIGDPDPSPRLKMSDLLEHARQLVTGAEP